MAELVDVTCGQLRKCNPFLGVTSGHVVKYTHSVLPGENRPRYTRELFCAMEVLTTDNLYLHTYQLAIFCANRWTEVGWAD